MHHPAGTSPLQSHPPPPATPPLWRETEGEEEEVQRPVSFSWFSDKLAETWPYAFWPKRLTCFADPLQVPSQLPLNLLLPPKLQELLPLLHTLSLFGKFSVETHVSTGTYADKKDKKPACINLHTNTYVLFSHGDRNCNQSEIIKTQPYTHDRITSHYYVCITVECRLKKNFLI